MPANMFGHSHPTGGLIRRSECLELMNSFYFRYKFADLHDKTFFFFFFILKSPGLFFLPPFCADHRNRTSQNFNNTEGKKRRKIHKTLLFVNLHYFARCSFCMVIFDYFPFPSFFFFVFWNSTGSCTIYINQFAIQPPSPFKKCYSQNSNSCVIITCPDFTQYCSCSDAQFS